MLLPMATVPVQWIEAESTAERNLALNRAAWASSSADFIQTGHMATDGQPTTMWQSAEADPQWIYVDLGAVCDVHSVVLRWGGNFALAYAIQGSADRAPSPETGRVEHWTDLHVQDAGKGGVESIPLAPTRVRYMRLLCRQRSGTGGYQLSAFEVRGTGGLLPAPTRMPEPEPDGTLRLSCGWRLMNQAYLRDDAASISMPGYDMGQWLVATVPGTVLTSYQNVGAVPDMFYGDDQFQVSDFFAHTNWWYRTEVTIPAGHRGKRTWLHMDGINYRAFVYVNGRLAGSMDGAFIRGKFDITGWVTPGKTCCIAVLVEPVPKPDKVNVRTLDGGYHWPTQYPANEPTVLAAASWDWLPTIRDRDTGIVNHVRLTSTGDVTIENPWATTHFPEAGNLRRADVTVNLELKNHASRAVHGTLKVLLGEISFSEHVTLAAGESRDLALGPQRHPQLSLKNPKLWWPSGYGEQNLHDLVLEFHADGKRMDTHKSRVGIREFTYNTASLTEWNLQEIQNTEDTNGTVPSNPLKISCNGQPIFVRGVNWGMSEGMLRCGGEGFERRLQMEREMNFNLIRNWAGNVDKPEFFDLCDEYGLMVWEEFGIANQIMPDNPAMWLKNARDRFLRRRHHACVVLWCSANESIANDPILTEMPKVVKALDGTRQFLQCSTQTPPTNGDGPYTTKPPSFYFKELAHGFRPELGSPTIPCVETLRRMMPHNRVWPVNEMWGKHDWWLGKGWGGSGVCGDTMKAIAAYGDPAGAEEFCRQAQMVNMETFKAIYESWNDRMWNDCTGVMIWMSNPAWPSLVWNTYDYYGEPTAAYFACRSACEPVHIQWNPVTNEVKAVNATLQDRKHLTAEAEIFNLDGSVFHRASAAVDCLANRAQPALRLFQGGEDKAGNLSEVHFVRLALKDSQGAVVSRNIYWRSKTDGKYAALRKMGKAQVSAKANPGTSGQISVEVQNAAAGVALMIRLKLVDPSSGLLISPVFYSDNYFSLAPGESRHVKLRTASANRGRDARLLLEGWNVKPVEVARVSI
jgi:beta-galactosidase/beta-glucuronidase